MLSDSDRTDILKQAYAIEKALMERMGGQASSHVGNSFNSWNFIWTDSLLINGMSRDINIQRTYTAPQVMFGNIETLFVRDFETSLQEIVKRIAKSVDNELGGPKAPRTTVDVGIVAIFKKRRQLELEISKDYATYFGGLFGKIEPKKNSEESDRYILTVSPRIDFNEVVEYIKKYPRNHS